MQVVVAGVAEWGDQVDVSRSYGETSSAHLPMLLPLNNDLLPIQKLNLKIIRILLRCSFTSCQPPCFVVDPVVLFTVLVLRSKLVFQPLKFVHLISAFL